MTTQSEKLKPCPFCGQAALSKVDNDEWEIARVECINQACRASGPHVNLGDFCSFDEAEAAGIEAWNTRPLTGGVTEEMRCLLGNIAQMMDAWKAGDPATWTEWDQEQRDAISRILAMSNASRGNERELYT